MPALPLVLIVSVLALVLPPRATANMHLDSIGQECTAKVGLYESADVRIPAMNPSCAQLMASGCTAIKVKLHNARGEELSPTHKLYPDVSALACAASIEQVLGSVAITGSRASVAMPKLKLVTVRHLLAVFEK